MRTLRNFILILLLTAVSCFAAAQSKQLQFSQVLLVGSSVQTVPAGRVWKVEGTVGTLAKQYRYASQSDADYNPPQNLILINGSAVTAVQSVGTGAGASYGGGSIYTAFSYAASPTNFPIWLPEGSTLAASTNVTFISVIEFLIINTP